MDRAGTVDRIQMTKIMTERREIQKTVRPKKMNSTV